MAFDECTYRSESFTGLVVRKVYHSLWLAYYTCESHVRYPLRVAMDLGTLAFTRRELRRAEIVSPPADRLAQEMGVSSEHITDLLVWEKRVCFESTEAFLSQHGKDNTILDEDAYDLQPFY